jgi:hypothetical protein
LRNGAHTARPPSIENPHEDEPSDFGEPPEPPGDEDLRGLFGDPDDGDNE